MERRKIICTTNARLNARYQRAVRARGRFPNEQAALKCLYLVTRSLDPIGGGGARWSSGGKAALNAFAITFEGRLTPSSTNVPRAAYTGFLTLPQPMGVGREAGTESRLVRTAPPRG